MYAVRSYFSSSLLTASLSCIEHSNDINRTHTYNKILLTLDCLFRISPTHVIPMVLKLQQLRVPVYIDEL